MEVIWKETTIGNAPIHIGDGNYSSMYPKSSEFVASGVPFITASDFRNGRISPESFRFISPEQHATLKKGHLKKGDVLIVTRGNGVGNVAWVDAEFEESNINAQLVLLRADESEIHNRFLYYLLSSKQYQELLVSFASGSAQPQIPIKSLVRVPIQYPSIAEQYAIAEFLGALDDKIELNRRMNQTLESMARAVFRQWFVDGEEVGDWEVGTLGDVVVNFDSKRVPLSKREREQRQGQYPYYGAASIMDYVDDYLFDGIYVLMAEDGSVVGDNDHPVLQYVWGKFWVNNHAHVLQGTNGICNEHLYLFLKEVNILPYVTGAVQPKLNQGNMNSIPFVIPPKELSNKFEEFVSPLFAKIRANEEESRTLASLRDSLLPKLMRGEVRVKYEE